jgi:hypothetical protein
VSREIGVVSLSARGIRRKPDQFGHHAKSVSFLFLRAVFGVSPINLGISRSTD